MPLFVKYPEQAEGRIDPTWGRTIDVLPTIADVLGIRLPFRVDGRSLRSPRPVPDSLAVPQERWLARSTSTARRSSARKAESLSHQIALLGTRTWDRAYRIGPHPELIGRAVETPRDAAPRAAAGDASRTRASSRRSTPTRAPRRRRSPGG